MAAETESDGATKQVPETLSGGGEEAPRGGNETAANLKSVGIDTDRMTVAASERVGELRRLVIEEVRAQPMRALAWAAAIGVVVGFWAAR